MLTAIQFFIKPQGGIMADYLLRLTEVNMEATRDAINVFDLYDL